MLNKIKIKIKSFSSSPMDDSASEGSAPTDLGMSGNTPSLRVSFPEVARVGTQKPSEPTDPMLDDLHILDSMVSFPDIESSEKYAVYEMRKWVFSLTQCNDFLDWTKQRNILWMSAGSGRGKTMLLTEIARQLSTNQRGNPNKFFLSYCFCGKSAPGLATAATTLKTLIWMILRQQPTLSSHLSFMSDWARRKYFDDPNDFFVLSGVFYNIVKDDRMAETYLLVDAIDEFDTDGSEPDLGDFMRLVMRSIESSKIKWVISTRTKAVINCAEIPDDSYFHVDLDSAYQYSLEGAVGERISEQSWKDFYKEVLDTMTIARQPLHILELAAIVDLPEGQIPVNTTTIVRKCSAFLEVRDGVIYLVDRSAKDHLRKYTLKSTQTSDAHAKMTKRLLNILSKSLSEANLRSMAPSTRKAEQDNWVSVRYSSVYWIWHMNKIEDIDKRTEIAESAVSFLITHFLEWLHILNTEWRVATVVTLLFQLKESLRVSLL